jgi:hypothetical protein
MTNSVAESGSSFRFRHSFAACKESKRVRAEPLFTRLRHWAFVILQPRQRFFFWPIKRQSFFIKSMSATVRPEGI